jgi:hypothetical protein
VEEYPQ